MLLMELVIANRNYSSWSLRPWLALKQTDLPFSVAVIPLRQENTKAEILARSPSGKVPALIDGDLTVWDSLAICEYVAESAPQAGLWPADPATRAVARSAAAEMHSGFMALRSNMPMNLRADLPGWGRTPDVIADIARIESVWTGLREKYASSGPFLFGGFTIADAMYAPVVTRFKTYGVALNDTAQAYADAVLEWPAMQEWREAALKETWTIDYPVLPPAP
jgi:glutathione S-transferase